MVAQEFRTEFAVSMHCDSCVQEIKHILDAQQGITSFNVDLQEQTVIVSGTVPPSTISRLLKESSENGRQVIVRGTGTASGIHAGAAVCIFESYTPPDSITHHENPHATSQLLHAMARMIQTSHQDDNGVLVLDLTIRHDLSTLKKKTTTTKFTLYIAKRGDLSQGAKSTGGILRTLGVVEINQETGYGDLFIEVPNMNVHDVIGRAMVVAPVPETSCGDNEKVGDGILAGVIARSAGVWGNDKKVCACSGQTMWEENRMSAQGKL